ncbi:betalactamase [Acanthamoeba castellanii str. Neff]|uniref:Betalactamase n=1 Tax=Acanthamoeba castellanii (strain ATCC 30010 / Neff) TaxID=1257118 RepID=L8GNE4_ACACF|nr:betalactamase [Acanthamoeba castellanii str. Neff]ELR13741.1 betalactamase [Acanthamoeba castellanii str. Neff]
MAGLPRSSPCGGLWGDCNVTTDEILRRINSQKTIQPIDTRPSYSNFGFALLGRLLEELVGESFESYVEKNILQSLNMTNTGFTFTPEVKSKMAVGYFDGTDQPAPLYDLGWEAPAGQMYSTVEDLCHLMSLIFRDLTSMGMPWENLLLTYPGNPNYWQKGKSGAVFGYTAEIMMIPELKLGVAVLMNGGLGGPALTAALQANAVLVPPLTQLLSQVQVPPALPPHPQNIVGSYKAYNTDPLPPIFQGITADVRLIQDETNRTRVLITIYIGHGTTPFFSALLDYYEAFNKDPNQLILQVAISSTHPDLCEEVLGGGNQLVYFTMNPTTGVATTFELKGLYYGFIFHHAL